MSWNVLECLGSRCRNKVIGALDTLCKRINGALKNPTLSARWLQDGPKTAPNSLKRGPRGLAEGPREAQERPQRPPKLRRWLQYCPERPPRGTLSERPARPRWHDAVVVVVVVVVSVVGTSSLVPHPGHIPLLPSPFPPPPPPPHPPPPPLPLSNNSQSRMRIAAGPNAASHA